MALIAIRAQDGSEVEAFSLEAAKISGTTKIVLGFIISHS